MKLNTLTNAMAATCSLLLLILLAGLAINFQDSRRAVADGLVIDRLQTGINDLRFVMVETILYGGPRSRQQWDRSQTNMAASLSEKSSDTPRERLLLNRMRANRTTSDTLYLRLTSAEATGDRAAEVADAGEVRARTVSSLLLVTQEMLDDANELSRVNQAAIVVAEDTGQALILVTVLLVGATMLWVWWLMRRRVLSPIAALMEGTARVTAGKLDHRLGLPGKDEIGSLARAFDAMTDQLQSSRDKLTESEARYRLTLEASSVGMWDIDLPSGKAVCDERWYEMLGFEAEAFPMSVAAWRSRVHPEDREVARAIVEELFASDETRTYEFRFRDGADRWRWLRWQGRVMARQDGKPTRAVGTQTDISARKTVELALLESDELKTSVLEHAAYAIIATDLRGIITVFNPGAETLLGYQCDELIGKETPARFHDPEEVRSRATVLSRELGAPVAPGFEVFVAKTLASGAPDENEWTYIRKDGSRIPVLLSVTARIDANGQIVGFLGIAFDITERKRSEEQMRIAAAAFESQEGMMVTDTDHVILRVNRAFTEITGYLQEEAVGQTPCLLSSGRHDAAFYAGIVESLEQNGAWQGEIWNRRKSGEAYPEWLMITAVKDEAGRASHYVGTFTDITLRKAAEDEIRNLAFYDPLTQLPNRRLLLDRLGQALAASARNGRNGALLFIDLDNFKTLNDTLGHDKGDLLLQLVAQRLATCIREGDTVARLGGDEFVVMLEDLSGNPEEAATQTETVGEKILATINQPCLLAGHKHRSTPSIGATLFSGHRSSVEELLKQADLAMYQAKAAGRNTLRFFDPEMQTLVDSHAALEIELREALAQRQFVLHYQPQVAGDGRVTGAEALVRWQHPQRGLVVPAEFIPLAEESGLILPLGHWVLKTACAQLASWAARPEMSQLTVSVNVSARQFHDKEFVAQVQAALDLSGANPRRLKLELTESVLVSNVEQTIARMIALKAQGVGFSLDDFGTGYSSLSYLKRLPLDQLKIDQSFVRDVLNDANDASIARTIIALARNLGLAVIAEGVETEAQRDFLAVSGCHAYQGYFFSRPLPVDNFEEFVRRDRKPSDAVRPPCRLSKP